MGKNIFPATAAGDTCTNITFYFTKTFAIGQDKNFFCGCGRSYKNKKHLQQHLKYECGKMPSFGCMFCTFQTKRKENLHRHVIYKHKDNLVVGERQFGCPCGRRYKYKKNLQQHMKYECDKEPAFPFEERQFGCPCGRRYKYKKNLQQHMKYECDKEPAFPFEERPFACPCGRRYKRKKHLNQHMKYECNKEPAFPYVNDGEESFPCDSCGRVYKYKRSLMQHLRYECGKPPMFSCPHCPYKAKKKNTLNTHVAIKHSHSANSVKGIFLKKLNQLQSLLEHIELKTDLVYEEVVKGRCDTRNSGLKILSVKSINSSLVEDGFLQEIKNLLPISSEEQFEALEKQLEDKEKRDVMDNGFCVEKEADRPSKVRSDARQQTFDRVRAAVENCPRRPARKQAAALNMSDRYTNFEMQYLTIFGGFRAKDMTVTILKNLMTDELALHYSYLGKKGKKVFALARLNSIILGLSAVLQYAGRPLEKFTCTTCSRSYKYKHKLVEHQRFACGKEPMFQSPSDIQNQTGSTGMYRCATCNRTYKYKTGLLKHLEIYCFIKHRKCINCSFPSSASSITGNSARNQTIYTCERCNRSYKYKHGLVQHRKYECGKEAMFQCTFCPHRAKRRENLRSHVLVKHRSGNFAHNFPDLAEWNPLFI
ncbi:oocyte zinc finger protein XlCOF6-like [Macrosteles quadrilineatus]|uniref:oocyte zinc finger protein XlCOF6-like n=1 Tax=Macrosteles quadrilineatus TaxID=74068 RepID=UPI0023E34845|nr:oocyte zinc finger protein XlCOF6-like [Macrosteles quadrilineatus]